MNVGLRLKHWNPMAPTGNIWNIKLEDWLSWEDIAQAKRIKEDFPTKEMEKR